MRARRTGLLLTVLLLLGLFTAPRARAEDDTTLTPILAGAIPTNVSQLRAMQQHIQKLTPRLVRATVAVQVGMAHGSGVIVGTDGYVLTAAHVAQKPRQNAVITLHDGRQYGGTTLGIFRTADAGLIRLRLPSDVSVEGLQSSMGDSSGLAPGNWCLATGHPGGFQPNRQPVVRLGRILSLNDEDTMNTDCTLIGGDSGGPLFDLEGRVIGIHSRIGGPLTVNLHVPVNIFRTHWERLAASEAWGHLPGSEPFLGVQGVADAPDARVARVFERSAAAVAGIQVGDVITRFGDHRVTDFDSLRALVQQHQPGDRLMVELVRGERRVTLELRLGAK